LLSQPSFRIAENKYCWLQERYQDSEKKTSLKMMSQISLEISKTNWRLEILFGIAKTKHCWLDSGGITLSESSVKLMSQIWLENCKNQIVGSWNGFCKCRLLARNEIAAG
jgi:hypothetical protein